MKLSTRLLFALAIAVVVFPAATYTHFTLLEPASWIKESERGDPQKLGPCGGDPKGQNQELVSNAITKAVGGSMLHLKVRETVYHPGHYRVALAVNSRNELPPDPMTFERYTDKGVYSVWAAIQSPPQIPVIADGLFRHYTRPAAGTPPAVFETDIQLPNISCARCTLQVIQFMADHGYNQPGGYSYHHCADLQITADPAKPIDRGWPAAVSSN
jgi:hypothetical protein